MRTIFMGTPDFSVPFIEAIARSTHNLNLVVTQPDRRKGRGKELQPPPAKRKAEELGIDVFQPESIHNNYAYQILSDIEPHLIVTAAYGQILPRKILDLPRIKAINVHASLLPEYRGAAPIHRAVMDGKEQTGVTIMEMCDKMDAGDILNYESVDIGKTDTTGDVYKQIITVGPQLLIETMDLLEKNQVTPLKQDENQVSYAPKLKKEDEYLDFSKYTNTEVFNRVRGLNPWPGAFTKFEGKRLKIWETKVHNSSSFNSNSKPGEIIEINQQGPVVKCCQGSVILTKIQPSGKKAMTGEQFIRGYDIKSGIQLE
ncbi:methionyl-tRNA formyltransferase [Natranaerobius thermophilus]|uniref:Methionyl-tRNA formyltransferase n=1 Tax=Natranaerobius thermophilus (strain ATCC BAA-1301 / DSM 18059 / JW/NM-WN-LF) TaxID=457570 RepID=FMT_NATTJ|nr:methionyl-tRNA formyltransferase [Natranaerobius thermophilus]B2A2K2.1 RecName: Full=Methionyl-tRNA formyltransferase [Natranaerobius thermophilus JW/NM-WN-LF]ACB84917.1 methionyl-tRNA formyltransferase [Natranaerobius thermophilus JW/NM-WN-LF]